MTDKPDKLNLEAQLKSLRKNLVKAQNEVQIAQGNISSNQEQISSIEELISKIEQIIIDYQTAHPALKVRQDGFEKYCSQKKACLENILCDKEKEKDKLCCIVNQEHAHITSLETDVADCEKLLDGECLDGIRKERDKKQNQSNKAKANYVLWLDPVESITARLNILEELKNQIDTEHSAGNHAYAYSLLIKCLTKEESNCSQSDEDGSPDEFCELVNASPDVVEPNCLRERITQAWCAYQDASNCFNNIDAQLSNKVSELETLQAQLEEAKNTLKDTIKRRLLNIENEECPPKEEECASDEKTTKENSTNS